VRPQCRLMGGHCVIGQVQSAIRAGSGRKLASWRCLEMVVRATLFPTASQRAVYLGNLEMKVHGNARTCPHCRNLIVTRYLQGNPLASVASEFKVTAKTVLKWVRRYETKGLIGLSDKSSRPHRIARRHPLPDSNFEAQLFSILHSPPTEFGFNRTRGSRMIISKR
jgi:leucine-zipper of insertion element IS481